jgi:hypothetical protein
MPGAGSEAAYPQAVAAGMHLVGEIKIACCGQSSSQIRHSIQSSGYVMTAFPLSSSILITSVQQLSTHIPQPLHKEESIRSIAIVTPLSSNPGI